MKSILVLSVVTLSFFLSASCNEPDDLIIDCEYYSHMAGVRKAPDSKPLDYYTDSAYAFSQHYHKYYPEQKSGYWNFEDSLLFEIDTVAYVSNHPLVDIMFELRPGGYQYEIGKMVLIETDPGLFKLLHAALTAPEVYAPEKTAVEDFGTYEIIYTKSRYHGQFTWYTEDYWIYNIEANCFRRLDYFATIEDTVKALMPDTCSLSRSVFVIDSLFWYNYLKKEGDHYRWPTCGRIKVWFQLKDCEIMPEKIIYDSDDKAPH